MPLLRLRHDRELQGRLFLVGLLVLASSALALCQSQAQQVGLSSPTVVYARVVKFGTAPSKYRAVPIVTLALDDGSLVSIGVKPAWAEGCKVGDRVALHRRGLNYRAAAPSCRET